MQMHQLSLELVLEFPRIKWPTQKTLVDMVEGIKDGLLIDKNGPFNLADWLS